MGPTSANEKTISEESEAFIHSLQPPKRCKLTESKLAVICSLIAAAMLGFITSSAWTWVEELPPKTLHCGNSATEAKALGCEFDLLAGGWVPRPCRDRTSDDEFIKWIFSSERKHAPFPYYEDFEGTRKIETLEALSKYNGTVFTTSEEHMGHCAQQGRRSHRAAISNGALRRINVGDDPNDRRVISNSHIDHCVTMTWKQFSEGYKFGDGGSLHTRFSIGYWAC